MKKKIQSALISVFSKEGIDEIARGLHESGVVIYSTGGTQTHLESIGVPVVPVESLTGYPSIFGGRVKTLHPKVFGGILYRRDADHDIAESVEFEIPSIDLVLVDLYPFEDTVASGASHEDIIEKIDIGGISLIRAAAKNYRDVLIIPSREYYGVLSDVLANGGSTDEDLRRRMAAAAFDVSSHYDSKIFGYISEDSITSLKISERRHQVLRYGENPHQRGVFYGDLDSMFTKLNGKELSYNNLLDVEAAVSLMRDFGAEPFTFAILKHNNACGIATRASVREAYEAALACDPVSAFGGILITNGTIDKDAATLIHDLFCEVIIAPAFDTDAVELLRGKANRIILEQKNSDVASWQVRTLLNGYVAQDRDTRSETANDLCCVTQSQSTQAELSDLIFANRLVKHTKSNTIVLAKNGQLCASGTGQTSRVDALKQAIEKALQFGFDLHGAVMASDAFFPFPDCVEIAHEAGIRSVVQPGGSIKDQLSIDFCNAHDMAMYMTGVRHFKH